MKMIYLTPRNRVVELTAEDGMLQTLSKTDDVSYEEDLVKEQRGWDSWGGGNTERKSKNAVEW